MLLQDILRTKGDTVFTTTPAATLAQVVKLLVQHNCGSLLVCDGADCHNGRLVGIITERDILRTCARVGAQLEKVTVGEVMTRDVVTGSPGDSVEHTMGVMTDRRVRHLPIVENDRLLGIISIGDVVKVQHDSLSLENHYLKTYLHSS